MFFNYLITLPLISNVVFIFKYKIFFFNILSIFNIISVFFFEKYHEFTNYFLFFLKKQKLIFFFLKKNVNLTKFSFLKKVYLVNSNDLFFSSLNRSKMLINYKNTLNFILSSAKCGFNFFFFSKDIFLYNDVLKVNLFFYKFQVSYILTFFLNKFFLLKNYKFFNIFLTFLLKNSIKNICFLDSALDINKQLILKKNSVTALFFNYLPSSDNYDFSDSHSTFIFNNFLKYFFFFYLVDSLLLVLKIKNKNMLRDIL